MGEFVIKMPDVGEGVAEAELVEWHVKPGDPVREDMVIAAVMTDKATVEIPSPVSGTVVWLGAAVGDTVAVKAPLVRIETAGEDDRSAASTPQPTPTSVQPVAETRPVAQLPGAATHSQPQAPAVPTQKPLASPAVRLFAQENGIDLRQVPSNRPDGRIVREDLERYLSRGVDSSITPTMPARNTTTEEIKLTGLRRRIAEKMSLSAARIPHITYVEEIDMTGLEELRAMMNRDRKSEQPKLTVLPFLMRAIVKAVADQPDVNATFDDDAGIVTRHGAVHIGIAAQTTAGLVVPVVRHAEARGIWDCAAEMIRLTDAARAGTATRSELSGSTITISSLGALGGIVSTPVINHPEVAIIGVNKIATRPLWDGTQFVPRKMMNLSSSFDHRIIDGFDAATFIQHIRVLLETPALIFIESSAS
jgi:2-oxoisovalerate dehydrogenase E2 component (dihydrolipoyl transacylase)